MRKEKEKLYKAFESNLSPGRDLLTAS